MATDSNLTPLTSAAAFFVAATPMVDTVFFLHLLPRFVHPAHFNPRHLEIEFLNGIYSRGFSDSSFVWFPTLIIPFYTMLFMNRPQFSCLTDF